METTPVPGLYLLEEVISPQEEKDLLEQIEKEPWFPNRNKTRLLQIYGPQHDSKYRTITDSEGKIKYTPHPPYSRTLVSYLERCSSLTQKLPEEYFSSLDQSVELFVNHYRPGDTLRQHHDHRSTYQECILGVSLLSEAVMTFNRGRKRQIKVKVPPRSVYLSTGQSRYLYQHGIREGGIKERRISLTYRVLKKK